ncbi:unnamed protein product [Gulo gulo]|uniref:Uncharacterized protein n=1 Tax=Gulo gulo TaxID=48420 RepID=A0A9X9LJN1_GULGU|nr:unnamed protein product [Gulo gulo]
MTLSWPRSTP